jgi:hypothetical protein
VAVVGKVRCGLVWAVVDVGSVAKTIVMAITIDNVCNLDLVCITVTP